MERTRAHILIVDDDATQGTALREAFARAGYRVTLTASSVQAVQIAQRQEFHALIVDCMLPKMNGVDLVVQILSVAVNPPFTILYSGVFKDKGFQKDAIERTRAAAFFTKPFALEDLLNLVNARFPAAAPDTSAGLRALYSDQPLDEATLARLFASEPTVPGLHLPMLYRRLQSAGVTGELVMITSIGELNSVSFHQGRVFAVRTPDKETAFGALAVGLGYVDPPDLTEALNNPERKLIGRKLIDSIALSPHALQLVMEEQLALRLSQTIEEGAVSINWVKRTLAAPDCTLSLERYQTLAEDWMHSKIEPAWIRDYLLAWGEHKLVGPAHRTIGAATLGDLLAHPKLDDDRDLPYLMRQLLNGNVALGPKVASADYRFLETRLTHLLHLYPQQNHFEILGIGEKAHQSEINRAFEDLRAVFDPATLTEGCPPRVMIKATQVFKIIRAAYDVLADDVERQRYLILQNNQRAQRALEAEPEFRRAIHLLQSNRAAEAAVIFETLIERRLDFVDLRAYRIWAGLASDRRYRDFDLNKVAPEQRYSAPYHMARGLFARNRGEFAKAVECFGAVVVIDPRLAVARAELEAAQQSLDSRTSRNLLTDLTTQIGRKFGRGA